MRGVDAIGFSTDPGCIAYGDTPNSGFQAVGLAIAMGARLVYLCGFDLHVVDGQRHYFGNHPAPLGRVSDYAGFWRSFERAVVPAHVSIINATPGSALRCFPMGALGSGVIARHAHSNLFTRYSTNPE